MSTIDLGVDAQTALPGREQMMPLAESHALLKTSMSEVPEGMERAIVALGCFWGAERVFWQLDGVHSTAVGYIGGFTKNPTYKETCSGRTGHTEAVLVIFDPKIISYETLLKVFWQSHDPTQGMRQGGDRGTQYRSGIYTTSETQAVAAAKSRSRYQGELTKSGFGSITTELASAGPFYFAEDYHQQYLHKNPQGYCGIGGTGVACPVGLDP